MFRRPMTRAHSVLRRTFTLLILAGVLGTSSASSGEEFLPLPKPLLPGEIATKAKSRKDAHKPFFHRPPPRNLPRRRHGLPIPGDGQAGIEFNEETGGGNVVSYSAGHQVVPSSQLQLPPVPPGAPYLFLYAPTGMPPYGCLESVTVYFRLPGDTSTSREWWVWDHCVAGNPVVTMPLDGIFRAKYVRNYCVVYDNQGLCIEFVNAYATEVVIEVPGTWHKVFAL